MCGFVGRIDYRDQPVEEDGLRRAVATLHSRGPDDGGVWVQRNVGLAHRRLAVIDTSHGGHQPMHSPCGRYSIVFNGELYNHQAIRRQLPYSGWQSQSDTETLLQAYIHWGSDCVQHFHGMFAFAVWDQQQQSLFLARDRMGEKPLYYLHDEQQCVFASRPKALLPLLPSEPPLDTQGIHYYLQSGYFPHQHSVFQGVHKLPPAHWMMIRGAHVTLQRYWDFRGISPEASWLERSHDDLLHELDGLITRCVDSRMLADVPLGAFLSGGIDSSLVVAKMCQLSSRKVKTFTIGFNDPQYDESSHAEAVAQHLGTEHHCQYLNVDDLLDLMPLFADAYDEPFFDNSAFPTMAVSRLARQHVTVCLSGDGGDELFGGYHYYRIAEQIAPFFRLPQPMRGMLVAAASCLPSHKVRLLAGALREPDAAAAFAFARSIAKDFGGLVLPEAGEPHDMRTLFSADAASFPSGISNGERGARLDASFTLPDDYLQKVDMGSMAFSLESREPLLDQELVEWAMRLPWPLKLRGTQNKYLLRELAYRSIPRDILDRPKQGFGVPIDRWLRGPLHDWAQDLLHRKSLFEQLPLSQPRALELFQLHYSGARNVSALLWAVLMLLNFVEHGSYRKPA